MWALTPKGNQTPVDVQPDREGGNTLLLRPSALAPDVLAVVLSGAALSQARANPRAELRVNHWATCPDREDWRAKQEARRAARAVE